MARIFIAAPSDDVAAVERILGTQHELVAVNAMPKAKALLDESVFDLIMLSVHFDESRMLELLGDVHKNQKNVETPVISFCMRDTRLSRTMQERLAAVTKALGAWMYLNQHEYNVVRNPDAELRRIIERCLTGEERKKTQAARLGIQEQREELQRLREALEIEEWSEILEDRVVELRRNLAAVLLELCDSTVNSLHQQEDIASSRDLEDRVSPSVMKTENLATREERNMSLDETQQTVKEVELGEREETKRTESRHKPTDDDSTK